MRDINFDVVAKDANMNVPCVICLWAGTTEVSKEDSIEYLKSPVKAVTMFMGSALCAECVASEWDAYIEDRKAEIDFRREVTRSLKG